VRAKEFERRIASRTGLPHAQVRLVLHTMREIAKEQLAIGEYVIVPKMMSINAVRGTTGTWKVTVSIFRSLTKAVGSDLLDPL